MPTSGGTAPGLADPASAGQLGGHLDGVAVRSRWERPRHLLAWSAAAAVLFACYLRLSGTVPVWPSAMPVFRSSGTFFAATR